MIGDARLHALVQLPAQGVKRVGARLRVRRGESRALDQRREPVRRRRPSRCRARRRCPAPRRAAPRSGWPRARERAPRRCPCPCEQLASPGHRDDHERGFPRRRTAGRTARSPRPTRRSTSDREGRGGRSGARRACRLAARRAPDQARGGHLPGIAVAGVAFADIAPAAPRHACRARRRSRRSAARRSRRPTRSCSSRCPGRACPRSPSRSGGSPSSRRRR